MARRETLRQIADRLEPAVARAFLDSIDLIKSDAQLGRIIDAIAQNNVERVLQLLNLDGAYFAPLDRSLTAAYQEAGDTVMQAWKAQATVAGAQVRGVFDARNPRAEEWLRTQSSRLITEILGDQRENIRALMVDNITKGTAPRTTALDMVGRINRATGKREGGIIGLHSRDVALRNEAFEALRNTEKPGAIFRDGKWRKKFWIGRDGKLKSVYETRDSRFDPTVRKAIKDGRPIPAEKARKMILGMENRMLKNRGETIARTELLGSTNAAQEEGLNQLVESGKVSAQNIKAKWDTADDGDQRDSHDAMDGQVRGHGEPFVSGLGNLLLHPGDRSLGAPAEDVINCRCTKRPDIDFIAQAAEDERAFA